jgi:hypothetical protein
MLLLTPIDANTSCSYTRRWTRITNTIITSTTEVDNTEERK